MARPCKKRNIEKKQCFTCFKPSLVPIEELKKVELQADELEAIRLADLKGVNMEVGAKSMEISPPTFCRLVKKARSKIADFIINGKRLRVYND